MTLVQSAISRTCFDAARLMLAAAAVAVAVDASAKDRPQAASAPEAPASMAAPAKKPAKTLAFKVVVTGDGKPVSGAEVILKPAVGSELKQFTNADGEASFSAPPGMAKVRVIATGWVSKRDEVTVADGKARAMIVLEH